MRKQILGDSSRFLLFYVQLVCKLINIIPDLDMLIRLQSCISILSLLTYLKDFPRVFQTFRFLCFCAKCQVSKILTVPKDIDYFPQLFGQMAIYT